jgi:HEAT repeat protein
VVGRVDDDGRHRRTDKDRARGPVPEGDLVERVDELVPGTLCEETERFLTMLQSDRSSTSREAAATWLGLHADLLDPDRVVPTLAGAEKDPDPQVRLSVATDLGLLNPRSQAATRALASAMKDGDPVVRVSAAIGLRDTPRGSEPARKVAISALAGALDDGNSAVRGCVAKALVKLGAGAQAVPELIATLRDPGADLKEESFRIRVHLEAINLLEQIGPAAKAAVPALDTALDDSNTAIGVAAAVALMKIGAPEKALHLLQEVAADSNEDPGYRARASATLAGQARDVAAQPRPEPPKP